MFWKGFCNCCVRGLVDYPDGYLLCSKIDRKMMKRCTGGDTRCRRTRRKQTCLRNRRLSTYRTNGLRRWSRWVHRIWTRTNCNKTSKKRALLTVRIMPKKNLRREDFEVEKRTKLARKCLRREEMVYKFNHRCYADWICYYAFRRVEQRNLFLYINFLCIFSNLTRNIRRGIV